MKKLLFACIVLFNFCFSYSQNVGIGTAQPDASAALDIQSNNKGLLIPRMSTGQRKAIASPAPGLMVFDTDKGCIYMHDGSNWVPLSGNYNSTLPLNPRTSNIPSYQAGFGFKASISGNYAVISSHRFNQPAVDTVYIFFKSGGNWVFQAKLVQSDPVPGDGFGNSVAINGDQLLIGAPERNSGTGAVYAFTRVGETWSQTAIITSVPQQAGSHFGVSISIDGLHALIGASAFKNNLNQYCGTVFSFYRNAGGWQQLQQLFGITSTISFGFSIDISGTYALVGAPYAAYNGMMNKGLAYLFKRTNLTWAPVDTIADDGSNSSNTEFGHAVAINESNGYAFISKPAAAGLGGHDFGVIYSYQIINNHLNQKDIMFSPALVNNDQFLGRSLSIYNDYLVVGATNVYNEGAAPGRVYIYKYMPSIPGDPKWQLVKIIKDEGNISNVYGADQIGFCVYINGFDIVIGNFGANNGQGKVLFANLE